MRLVRKLLSFKMAVVDSGMSQKSFLEIRASSSFSRFCLVAKSKTIPELCEFGF